MGSIGKRLEHLERRTGTDVPVVVVDWGDGVVVNGEKLTTDEFRKRFPDAVIVEWPDNA